MATEWWIIVWDSMNGDVVDRLGPYPNPKEAWKALEEEVKELCKEGWDCDPSPSDPPGYNCHLQVRENGEEYHYEYWLTVEECPA